MSEDGGGLERREGLRASDTDRERVAEVLRAAAGDGRLTLDELDERLELAYTARTYADLVPLTADLPGSPAAQAPIAGQGQREGWVPALRFESSMAIFGGADRRGVWELPAEYAALAVCGGVKLDLRLARFTAPETVITANVFCGGVDIVVNRFTQVIVEGVGVMGGFSQARDRVDAALSPDSPVVRVRGVALMGGVTVTRRDLPRAERRRQLPH